MQANVNQEGIALLSSGGQYLNMNTAYGVNGFGLRGNDSSSDVLGIKNSVGDAWGQPYHTNMVSGQGAYVEVATVYTRITNGTFTFDVSSLGIASGDMPSLVELWMKRTGLAPEVGYVTNDWVRPIIGADAGNNSVGSTISSTHNTVTLSIMGGAGANGSFYAIGKDTPGGAAKNYFVFGNTGWTLVCKAWK